MQFLKDYFPVSPVAVYEAEELLSTFYTRGAEAQRMLCLKLISN